MKNIINSDKKTETHVYTKFTRDKDIEKLNKSSIQIPEENIEKLKDNITTVCKTIESKTQNKKNNL